LFLTGKPTNFDIEFNNKPMTNLGLNTVARRQQKEWQSEDELKNHVIVQHFHQLATSGKTPQATEWAQLHDEVESALP